MLCAAAMRAAVAAAAAMTLSALLAPAGAQPYGVGDAVGAGARAQEFGVCAATPPAAAGAQWALQDALGDGRLLVIEKTTAA